MRVTCVVLAAMAHEGNVMQPCSLLSLATAVPPHVVEQVGGEGAARASVRRKKALFDRLSGVFDNAGIAKRHIVAPLDWYMARPRLA